jgi:hypothetical protein
MLPRTAKMRGSAPTTVRRSFGPTICVRSVSAAAPEATVATIRKATRRRANARPAIAQMNAALNQKPNDAPVVFPSMMPAINRRAGQANGRFIG